MQTICPGPPAAFPVSHLASRSAARTHSSTGALELVLGHLAWPTSTIAVTAYLSDQPNWPTFHLEARLRPGRGADAEHCCCSLCGAGVPDDRRKSRPATGGRSVAAIAEGRRLKKAE